MKSKYLIFGDGSSTHILKWVKELVNHFDVYLVSLNGVSDEVYEYIDQEKIFILNNNMNAMGGNHKLILKLFKIRAVFKKINPKYINAHYLSSYGFLAALSKGAVDGVVIIQSVWGSDILVQPFTNMLRKKIAQYSLRKSEYVTSESWHLSDVVSTLFSESRVLVFPFGLELIEHPLYQKKNMIFSNRALKSFYNIDKIIDWFSHQESYMQLIVANEGTHKRVLQKQVNKLGLSDRVLFVGYLSPKQQQQYYKESRYFISIPNTDSISVSLLEALQYGTLPIVSNIPANREWILDGVNGVYFDQDMRLNSIEIEEDFAKINQRLLQKRANFSTSIKRYINQIQRII